MLFSGLPVEKTSLFWFGIIKIYVPTLRVSYFKILGLPGIFFWAQVSFNGKDEFRGDHR